MGQVVQFPKRIKPEKKIEPPDDLIDSIVPYILERMIEHGYNITDDFRVKDIALIVESVNAAMSRALGKHHGLHILSNKINITGC